MAPRLAPFELVFGTLASERFPAVRAELQRSGHDPRDRDAFLLLREVAVLLQELRPEAGIGAGLDTLAGLLHHAYLYWADGQQERGIGAPELRRLLAGSPPPAPAVLQDSRPSSYTHLAPLLVWATPVEQGPAEPLDGWFSFRAAGELSLLAVFGVHAARPGFTAVELAGPPPLALQRSDGTPLFAPLLSGGAAAGLASLAGSAELLELAWRAEALA